MLKVLFVGMVLLASSTAHAQGGALESIVKMASAQSGKSTQAITRSLFAEVEASSSALAQAVKNDPLYIFNKGSMNEESLRYLGADAQNALLQIGKSSVLKSVATTTEFQTQLNFTASLSRSSENIALSSSGQVKVAVNPEAAIEREVSTLGLSPQVANELSTELKTFRSETGLSYTNRGMCQGLGDEAAANFTKFLKDTRENLKRTRAKCPAQFYGSIAESWIHFEKGLGREGADLLNAVQKVQSCYTSARIRPGVLSAVQQISTKTGGTLAGDAAPTGCPL